jgi:hypothetical protein
VRKVKKGVETDEIVTPTPIKPVTCLHLLTSLALVSCRLLFPLINHILFFLRPASGLDRNLS